MKGEKKFVSSKIES